MVRQNTKLRIICGVNVVAAALNPGNAEGSSACARIHSLVYVREGTNQRVQKLIDCARLRGIEIRQLERSELTRLCATDRHQGIAAYTERIEHKTLAQVLRDTLPGKRFFLLLDSITDPHNFGALIRSAAAAGCQAVIYAKDRSCQVTPVVEKAAAGTVGTIALCQVTNLARTIETLKAEGIWVYGLALEDATSIYATNLRGDMALVAGSEGRGLRPGVLQVCDAALQIPMPGKIESLNVSVATGIALFEAVRQRLEIEKKTQA